jgi:hypothetical protein
MHLGFLQQALAAILMMQVCFSLILLVPTSSQHVFKWSPVCTLSLSVNDPLDVRLVEESFSRSNAEVLLCHCVSAVHDVLGLEGSEFQSLYHFTVGVPLVDKRLLMLPAYPEPAMDA